MVSLLLTISLSVIAKAEIACTPLPLLHASINFCVDNPKYLQPAIACRDNYKNLVESRKPVIQKILTGQLKNADAKGHAQNKDLSTSQNIYTSARNMLTDLINRGNQVYAELGAYGDDFVPPIPSWAPGYFKPNRKDKNDPARNLNFYCYAEPMASLDVVLDDVEKIVKSLEKARAEVIALDTSANVKESNVGKITEDSTGIAPAAGSAVKQVVPVNPGIRNSDVTGLEEDMASEKNLGKGGAKSGGGLKSPGAKKALPAPKQKSAPQSSRSTTNTNSPAEAAASNRLPTPAVSSAEKNSAAGHSSVGSLIWSEPKDGDATSTDLKINVGTDSVKQQNAPTPTSLEEKQK